MRKFELVRAGKVVGRGTEKPDGSVEVWCDAIPDNDPITRRYVDEPEPAKAGRLPDWPGMPQLPSEWIAEWGRQHHGTDFRNPGEAALAICEAIVKYLDERLGRAPGEGKP